MKKLTGLLVLKLMLLLSASAHAEQNRFLENEEVERTLKGLYDICGDTFCQDLNFEFVSGSCDSNSCTIKAVASGHFYKETRPEKYRYYNDPLGFRAFQSSENPDVLIKFHSFVDHDLEYVFEASREEFLKSRSVGVYSCTINNMKDQKKDLQELFISFCTKFDW